MLAIYSSKKVSRRHEIASESKSTIGSIAKTLRRKLKRKDIVANYLLHIYIDYYHKIPEWHHSGFFNSGKDMGKTYFLNYEECEEIVNNFPEMERVYLSHLEENIFGFYWIWGEIKGKAKKVKILKAYSGLRKEAPTKNFTECTSEQYSNVLIQEKSGKIYEGFDEPTAKDFSARSNDEVYGFYWTWDIYGRDKYKRLEVYHGVRYEAPKNFTECSLDIYKKAAEQVGRIYKGWDEPCIGDFE